MNRGQEPNPEFVDRLEWQVRTALQRQTRFSEPVRHANGGTMKLVTVILVSALFGAGGVVVKDEVQEGQVQEVLLAQVDMEIQLAQLQVEAVQTDVEQLEQQVTAGVVEEETLLAARAALREADSHLKRLQLDREEIRATGKEPQDALAAPLVQGRDFVTERVRLETVVMDEHLRLAVRQLDRVQELVAAGMVRSDEATLGAAVAVQQVESRLGALQQRLQLRQRFLDGEVTATEAVSQALMIEARADLETQEQRLDVAARQLQDLEDRAARGLVSESDVRAARLDLRRMELARRLAELKLQQISGGGGPPTR